MCPVRGHLSMKKIGKECNFLFYCSTTIMNYEATERDRSFNAMHLAFALLYMIKSLQYQNLNFAFRIWLRNHSLLRSFYYRSLYCRAVSVTDNLCSKQGNSSIFWSKICSSLLRAVSDQKQVIMSLVNVSSVSLKLLLT